jgi:hypothetical protein
MSAGAAILAWVLLAVNAWGARPIPPEERVGADEVRQRAAEAIVDVAYDVDEEPIFRGDYGRARTALWMVSTGGEESRFLARILNGHCRPGECDRGLATGAMQVHLGPHGMRVLGDREAWCGSVADDCWTKADLVDDWSLQFRAGLHTYRTLGPRAFTRWQRASAEAAAWYARNPPPATDEQVAGGVMLALE